MTVVAVDKDLDNLRLTVVAEFDAPIERVWELWADPRKLERWWGPPGWPATFGHHDLRVGGEATYEMSGPGGAKSRGWWRVTAADPPRELDFTDGWTNPDGTRNTEGPTIAVQVRIAERGGVTRMELHFVYSSPEHMAQVERLGAFEAIPQCVAQMDALLERKETDPWQHGSS